MSQSDSVKQGPPFSAPFKVLASLNFSSFTLANSFIIPVQKRGVETSSCRVCHGTEVAHQAEDETGSLRFPFKPDEANKACTNTRELLNPQGMALHTEQVLGQSKSDHAPMSK